MSSRSIRMLARERLRGNWATAIAVGFLTTLLTTSITLPTEGEEFRIMLDWLPDFMSRRGTLLILTILSVWGYVVWIFGGVIELGSAGYFLSVADGRPGTISTLFSEFPRFGKAFVLSFLTNLFVALWSLLLVIPGIIATYSYSMAVYIMSDHPEVNSVTALRMSKELMQGHKMELFLLDFSFLGWSILSVLTFGILNLWVTPYMYTARALFYRHLNGSTASDTYEDQRYRGPEF